MAAVGRHRSRAGQRHVGYESAPIHPLQTVTVTPPGLTFDWRVQKMSFNRDKTVLRVNAFTELRGFTGAMFDPKLGVGAALDWVVVCSRQNRRAFGFGQRSQSGG